MRETIGDYLFRRLTEAGVEDVFGVPGDFNLNLMQQLEDRGSPRWYGNCNELNASYAADGYARLKGLSALIVTNGVGALSAINGIAGAHAEHVPVICICGSLPLSSVNQRRMMHHTFASGTHDEFFRAFVEVTAAQARITQSNAVVEIDRLITTAWHLKRPVYLEIPSDISYLEIDTPAEPLQLTMPRGDRERIDACVAAIVNRLATAKAPVMLLDMDTSRFQAEQLAAELADKVQMPVATMPGAKSAFSEQSALFIGQYAGALSHACVRSTIETSDCLLTIGFRRVDSTSGFFTDRLPSSSIHLNDFYADVGEVHFEGITLQEVLAAAISAVQANATPLHSPAKAIVETPSHASSGALRQHEYWKVFAEHLKPGDVIIAEDGTSSSGAGSLLLPVGCTFITQAIWGSIGYTLGCLLGALVAAPQRRCLLFIGDGSFQLTAQELSTILRHNLRPQIFLINNAGYTIERTILGKTAKYNDIADWSYADLPKMFARREVNSVVVETEGALIATLHGASDDFLFVEARMSSNDAPFGLIKGGHASADTDYGPRGPQREPGAQISLPPPSTP